MLAEFSLCTIVHISFITGLSSLMQLTVSRMERFQNQRSWEWQWWTLHHYQFIIIRCMKVTEVVSLELRDKEESLSIQVSQRYMCYVYFTLHRCSIFRSDLMHLSGQHSSMFDTSSVGMASLYARADHCSPLPMTLPPPAHQSPRHAAITAAAAAAYPLPAHFHPITIWSSGPSPMW